MYRLAYPDVRRRDHQEALQAVRMGNQEAPEPVDVVVNYG